MRANLLILDLDNTLYDWIEYFATSYSAMVETASGILQVEPDRLLDELRIVHQRRSDSEYPFALLDTDTVRHRFDGDRTTAKRALQPSFDRFNESRDRTLRLYPGVSETLHELKGQGLRIVAYTNASIVNVLFRLRKLEVLHFFSRVYARSFSGDRHPIAGRDDTSWIGSDLVQTFDDSTLKPNPRFLERICRREGSTTADTLCVGDSLVSDIAPAIAAGCESAYARYGTRVRPELWERVVRISHWTSADIERHEELSRGTSELSPTFVLRESFAEILDCLRLD